MVFETFEVAFRVRRDQLCVLHLFLVGIHIAPFREACDGLRHDFVAGSSNRLYPTHSPEARTVLFFLYP